MKTNAKKHAAGAVFPSSRIAAPARSLGAARARVAGDDETSPVVEKRLKAAAPEPTRAVRSVRKSAASASAAKAKRKQPVARAKAKAKAKASSKSPQAKRSTQASKSNKSTKSVKAPKTSAARTHAKAVKAAKTTRKATKVIKPGKKAAQPQAKSRVAKSPRANATVAVKPKRSAKVELRHAGHTHSPANHNKPNQPVVLLSHKGDSGTSPSAKSAVAKGPAGRATEVRSAPAVVPSSPATHTGRGDATLARYMSELATYELLGRDDEIRLAQEVESLEVAFWRVMLGMPQATMSQ